MEAMLHGFSSMAPHAPVKVGRTTSRLMANAGMFGGQTYAAGTAVSE